MLIVCVKLNPGTFAWSFRIFKVRARCQECIHRLTSYSDCLTANPAEKAGFTPVRFYHPRVGVVTPSF